MINIYTQAKALAAAIAGNAAVLTFCKTNFGLGCLVQVDDKSEDPMSSDAAPWVVLLAAAPGELGATSSDTKMSLLITAGVCAPSAEPTVTTVRSTTANGLQSLGIGEKAEELLRLALAACKSANLGAGISIKEMAPRMDASTFFPLQMASATLLLAEEQDLSTFA